MEPRPYRPMKSRFEDLPDGGENWLSPTTRRMLFELLEPLPPGSQVLEIGSWLGRSACHILETNPELLLYCLDTWANPSPVYDSNPGQLNNLSVEPLIDRNHFERFRKNMAQLGLLESIIIIPDDSRKVMDYLKPGTLDAVFIDGSHEEEIVYQDFKNAYHLLKVGGFIMGDDWNWPSVSKGVMRAFWELNSEKEVLAPMRSVQSAYATCKV